MSTTSESEDLSCKECRKIISRQQVEIERQQDQIQSQREPMRALRRELNATKAELRTIKIHREGKEEMKSISQDMLRLAIVKLRSEVEKNEENTDEIQRLQDKIKTIESERHRIDKEKGCETVAEVKVDTQDTDGEADVAEAPESISQDALQDVSERQITSCARESSKAHLESEFSVWKRDNSFKPAKIDVRKTPCITDAIDRAPGPGSNICDKKSIAGRLNVEPTQSDTESGGSDVSSNEGYSDADTSSDAETIVADDYSSIPYVTVTYDPDVEALEKAATETNGRMLKNVAVVAGIVGACVLGVVAFFRS